MFYVVALGVFFLDIITKLLVVNKMDLGQSIPVIKNVFHFTYIVNRGAAFGIFPQGNFFFIIISFVGIIIVVSLYRKLSKEEYFFCLPLGFILGGILGNLFDRIVRGEVVDFFDFRIWPIFNFADTFICIGISMIFLFTILGKKSKLLLLFKR
ncbi:signal peptidase II [bacterium]|nr:signal peptidase II [bacterium]